MICSQNKIKKIVKSARDSFCTWKNLSIKERKTYISKIKREIEQNSNILASIITRETGKTLSDSIKEVQNTKKHINYILKNIDDILKPKKIKGNILKRFFRKDYLLYEPIGVVGIISSWNYPFEPLITICAALITGNSVIWKPSELTPLVSLEIETLIKRLNLPKNVFNMIIGDHLTGRQLVASNINKLHFTGDLKTGIDVMKQSSERLHPLVLELGGKDAAIVCKDADLELTANGIVWGAFMNAGQVCCSVERVYVVKEIADEFIQKTLKKTQKLIVGNALDRKVHIGPVINFKQLKKIMNHIKDAEKKGAKILVGGECLKRFGPLFFSPTILTNVNHSMKIMKDETFGPVLPIKVVKDEEEAIRLVNDSEYGLTASIWSKDIKRAQKIAKQIEAGTVCINDLMIRLVDAPWGGVKKSGFGKSLAKEGILEFTNIKHVSIYLRRGKRRSWWFNLDE